MKRVNLIFASLTIIATASGILAFKTINQGTGNRYCSTSPNVTAPHTADYIADPSGNLDRYCTTVSGGTTGTSTIKVFQVIGKK